MIYTPPHRHRCEAQLAILMLLAKLSHPRALRPDMEQLFKQDQTRISRFIALALNHVYRVLAYTLAFDTQYLQEQIPFFAKQIGIAVDAPRPENFRVWGFIDGVFRRFLRPSANQESVYNGHYGGHGFKFQMLVAPDGMLVDVAGPYHGRLNDSEMTRESLLEERLSDFCTIGGVDFLIYGDPAYTSSRFVEKPFRRIGATDTQSQFNTMMSRGRISVEHAIGKVTHTFTAIDFVRVERVGNGEVGKKYLVAVILRNMLTCIRGRNQISTYFGCPPPTIEEFIFPFCLGLLRKSHTHTHTHTHTCYSML